jgi:hypothetical protein
MSNVDEINSREIPFAMTARLKWKVQVNIRVLGWGIYLNRNPPERKITVQNKDCVGGLPKCNKGKNTKRIEQK